MQAVILAAGHGTRLRPHTEILPKQLLQINGKPILEYGLASLPEEIDEVILVVGWLAEKIHRRFGEKFLGRDIKYVHQNERLGTGHALSLCRDILKDRFLVMMGDDLYEKKDIEKCLKHERCILTIEVKNPQDFAVVEVDESGYLKTVTERPHHSSSNLVNTGLYVLDNKFFDYPMVAKQTGSNEYGLPQTIAKAADDYKVYVEKATFWQPVNTKEELEKARLHFQKQ
jgi:UDP-N-acetylglucosamine diphosphorylase / glucose-1-phosphate thymidylyltransferase / UDP-N-acetylgalactosamine diphosphorylase / glucosamine-1-phosphate N-acetyltransferase / galactosamine-1-phosphate N-acetyltransferase